MFERIIVNFATNCKDYVSKFIDNEHATIGEKVNLPVLLVQMDFHGEIRQIIEHQLKLSNASNNVMACMKTHDLGGMKEPNRVK